MGNVVDAEKFREWIESEVRPKLNILAAATDLKTSPGFNEVVSAAIKPYHYWLSESLGRVRGPLSNPPPKTPIVAGGAAAPQGQQSNGLQGFIQAWTLRPNADGTIGMPEAQLGVERFKEMMMEARSLGFEYVKAVPGRSKGHLRRERYESG